MSGQPLTELVNRSKELFDGTNLIITGDVADPQLLALCRSCRLADVITDNYVTFSKMAAMLGQQATDDMVQSVSYKHITVHFAAVSAVIDKLRDYDCALVLLNKSKHASVEILSLIQHRFSPSCRVYLAGANSGGGKSADSLLKDAGTPFKVDSARKCTLFGVKVEHTFKNAPAVKDVAVAGNSIRLLQSYSVFSCGKLDEGTALLLEILSTVKPETTALDLGCGCGVVGISLKKAGFAKVTCVDVSAAALDLTQKNASLNNTAVEIRPSDMLENTSRYDLIAVNPPFHQGISTDRSPTLDMLSKAPLHLNDRGVMYLVGNAFLKYERVLAQIFRKVEIVKGTTRFSVIRASMQ